MAACGTYVRTYVRKYVTNIGKAGVKIRKLKNKTVTPCSSTTIM